MNWVIILIAVIAVVIVSKVIHFRHFQHKITAILIIVLTLFLYSTFTAVVHNHDIDLKTVPGVMSAGKVYVVWLGQAFNNLKTLTGNAVKMDWMPQNVSISSPIG